MGNKIFLVLGGARSGKSDVSFYREKKGIHSNESDFR